MCARVVLLEAKLRARVLLLKVVLEIAAQDAFNDALQRELVAKNVIREEVKHGAAAALAAGDSVLYVDMQHHNVEHVKPKGNRLLLRRKEIKVNLAQLGGIKHEFFHVDRFGHHTPVY